MPSASVVLADACHARPASQIAALALANPGTVTLTRADGIPVDAASVLALMAADLRAGEQVRVQATGPGADALVAQVTAILSAR